MSVEAMARSVTAAERRRLKKLLQMEEQLCLQGSLRIAGVDEAGRGPLAGPVVAGACLIPEGLLIAGINDSKQLSASEREEVYAQLTTDPRIQIGVGVVDAAEIDRVNIYQATIQAMLQAVAALGNVDLLLVDGLQLPHPHIPVKKVIGGDALCYSIAAASIVAKVHRDRLMRQFDDLYPGYGFAQHKGYGTKAHLQALNEHGPCPIHRRSFSPVLAAGAPC